MFVAFVFEKSQERIPGTMSPIIPTSIGLAPVQAPAIPTEAFAGAAQSAPQTSAIGPGQTFQNFGDLLGQALDAVNGTQAQADAAATALVTGQSTDIHTVMIDMQKAKTTFDLAVQVRNKSLDAYNELMHTQF
jgi:flagellar hook-basal body complex protein FliE